MKKVTNENQDTAEALGEVVPMPTWAFTPTHKTPLTIL